LENINKPIFNYCITWLVGSSVGSAGYHRSRIGLPEVVEMRIKQHRLTKISPWSFGIIVDIYTNKYKEPNIPNWEFRLQIGAFKIEYVIEIESRNSWNHEGRS